MTSFPIKRILRSKHVVGRVKLSRSEVYELVKRDRFPKPFKLVQGERASGWLESEIDEWIDSRASERGEQ
jgi:prophage regulatory protein